MCRSSDEAELRHLPQMLQEWSVAPASALCCGGREGVKHTPTASLPVRPSLFRRKSAYLSDVHGELVLRLTVFVAQRTDEGGAVVFGVLGNKTGFRTSGLARTLFL